MDIEDKPAVKIISYQGKKVWACEDCLEEMGYDG